MRREATRRRTATRARRRSRLTPTSATNHTTDFGYTTVSTARSAAPCGIDVNGNGLQRGRRAGHRGRAHQRRRQRQRARGHDHVGRRWLRHRGPQPGLVPRRGRCDDAAGRLCADHAVRRAARDRQRRLSRVHHADRPDRRRRETSASATSGPASARSATWSGTTATRTACRTPVNPARVDSRRPREGRRHAGRDDQHEHRRQIQLRRALRGLTAW